MNRVPSKQEVTFIVEGQREDESSDSLPLKKQKLNEEDEEEDDYSEEEFCPNYPQKVDKAVWDSYFKQLDESEGFDIEDYPGSCPMATVYPLPRFLKNPDNHKLLMDYAGRALKLYNDTNGTDHKIEDVLKVNGGGCRYYIFYVTFSIKTCDGKRDLFQAKPKKDLDI
ncbi:uncharacterized protein LOC132037611 isoform X2 [Lycium ferocissimum]|uniref:uncharacterized protein LOC132037611 isoform X2 n=1 Tax=Lycium ferocissimum TaxID=112874 RepID=UPI0028166588|nr:uncharacterized protein LOC132037611 isoform X2 [Lycium ferocissimum]